MLPGWYAPQPLYTMVGEKYSLITILSREYLGQYFFMGTGYRKTGLHNLKLWENFGKTTG